MRWLDPVDCVAARDCLGRGNPMEAARILLRSPQKDHRVAHELLLVVSGLLVEQAAAAFDRGEMRVAGETIELARQCAELPAEAAALGGAIDRAQAAMQRDKQWVDERFDRAKAWADQGRVRSALHLLQPLAGRPDTQCLRLDLEERMDRFERYLREVRQHLERGDLSAARRRWKMAQAINAADPEVVQLEKELREHEAARCSGQGATESSRPVADRSVRFALGHFALVLSEREIVLGNPLDPAAHVPIQSRVHRRHARIVRDRDGYRLYPYFGCETLVQGAPAADSRLLKDGDLIELGGQHCRWKFMLPVSGSPTAVLESTGPAPTDVRTPDGRSFRRVVLMDDALEVRRQTPAHLVLEGLPCEALTFRWTTEGCVVEAQNGEVRLEGESAGNAQRLLLLVPCWLVIERQLSEADRLGQALMGVAAPDQLRLEIRDPFVRRSTL